MLGTRTNSASRTLILIGSILAWLLALVGAITWTGFLGLHAYLALGSSMGETIPSRSLVVTRSVNADDVQVGEIILFRSDPLGGLLVTHRVVAVNSVGGSRSFLTRGDGNSAPDPFPVPGDAGIERVVASVPHVGVLLPVSGAIAYLVAVSALWVVWLSRRRARMRGHLALEG